MGSMDDNGQSRPDTSQPPPSALVPREGETAVTVSSLLPVPWHGLRPDLVLYPGPLELDGQRSWVLEDPVRGANYRLGYVEGEFLYRLVTEPDLDAAVRSLYRTTSLRPTLSEILSFVQMLQRENLTCPSDDPVAGERLAPASPGILWQILHGQFYFRIPVLRPDGFLFRSLPLVSILWSPACRWLYLICGLIGLGLTLQDLDHYLSTVSYLFTPQGGLCFFLCLAMIKIGHEFAHAYAARSMGLHVRSMGVLFIVVWPLLYTDTTDVWKIPDRRRRMRVAAAGVLFEAVVAGLALLAWACVPDGVLRSLMFFLSGASLVSTVLINLCPFMRYDGYYLLMDYWGIDNLRSRSFGQLRYMVRRLLLDWKGPPPEVHPHRTAMAVFGLMSLAYRLSVSISIAVAIYYLFFPLLGLLLFLIEIWLFVAFPILMEVRSAILYRRLWGSRFRLFLSGLSMAALLALIFVPLPRLESVPCLFRYPSCFPLEAPAGGEISGAFPEEGSMVKKGELLTRIRSRDLEHEALRISYDLASSKASIKSMSSGGEQGGYRKWLMAESERLAAAYDKHTQAVALLEIRAPADGQVAAVNPDLYIGAFVGKNTHLLTVMDPRKAEVEAYVNESLAERIKDIETLETTLRFASPLLPDLDIRLVDKSPFPVAHLMNTSLLDVAKGPITSVRDSLGLRPRDPHFAYRFEILGDPPLQIPHGMPGTIRIRRMAEPVGLSFLGWCRRTLLKRGLF